MFLPLLTGCGDRRTYSVTEMVEGVVTLDGIPVEGAEVTFHPLETGVGESAVGKTDAQGMYRLSSMKGAPGKGTTAGEYQVTVSQWVTRELDEPYVDHAQDALIQFESKEMLPAVYTEIQHTPLTATVAPGKNEINFALDSKAVIERPGR